VIDYLKSWRIKEIRVSENQDLIRANVSIHVLEKMLETSFATYQGPAGILINRITSPYFLPARVARYVSFISELIRFPYWHSPILQEVRSPSVWADYCGSNCHGWVTPEVINQQYNISKTGKEPSNGNAMAVAEFQGQEFDYADLNAFYDACDIPRQKITAIGGNDENKCDSVLRPCIESLLDIEYLSGLAYPIPTTTYYSATFSIYDWLTTIVNDANAPWVHSVSYGNDEVQQTSVAYMNSVNVQLQMAGAKGLTVLFASGDQGVWGRTGSGDRKFNPDFPAGSPYVTAVGGTELPTATIGATEVCCPDGGGGFSNTFARPSYQATAVNNYIKSGVKLPPQSYWNISGRAYPDVSAVFGLNIGYCIVSAGNFMKVAGTSASCPVVASMFALLNDIRLSRNQTVLGFANPWLYQTFGAHPEVFHDVTSGTNNAGQSYGFPAAPGWDPCTGVGTINYGKLAAFV